MPPDRDAAAARAEIEPVPAADVASEVAAPLPRERREPSGGRAQNARAIELMGAELAPADATFTAFVPDAGVVELPDPRPYAWTAVPARPRRKRFAVGRRFAGRCWKPVQVGALSLVAYVFLFNLSVVRGSSMAPRIHDGDRILIDHVSYLFHAVERGDIVVLQYPLDPSVDYIKRVVGLPGDEILIERGAVWVNGKQLDEPYVETPDPLTQLYVRVQPAHYFVLGDNRRRSSDSREFGQVPVGYVRGKVELRLWPPERIGAIDG